MALAIGRAEAEYADASAHLIQTPAAPSLLLVLQTWSNALEPAIAALESSAPDALEPLRHVYLYAYALVASFV